jgi:Ca2+-binding EF-hand superfamily protein
MFCSIPDETKPAEGPDELLAERFDWWDKNNDNIIDYEEVSLILQCMFVEHPW